MSTQNATKRDGNPSRLFSVRHSWIDDLQGCAIGVVLTGLGLHVLAAAGLTTGQVAGAAATLTKATGVSFGAAFFLLNLPFYIFAWLRLGWAYTLRTLGCVTGVSALLIMLPKVFVISQIDIVVAAIISGVLVGMGVLAFFRHGASGGGMGIAAAYLQDRYGIKAGIVQLCVDVLVFGVAWFFFEPKIWAASLLGALVMNLLLAENHRRDWYVAR